MVRNTHEFPFKVIFDIPGSENLPQVIRAAFQAVELNDRLGTEYHPKEYIMWIQKPSTENSN